MLRLFRRTSLYGSLLLGVSLALSANSASHAESLIRRGIVGEPNAFDPAKASLWHEYYLMKDMFEGLVIYDNKGNIAPGVAQSWEADADGSVYTFKLRDNAKWSDGTPVTAHDFAYSWKRKVNPETASMDPRLLYPVKNAQKISKGEMKPDDLGVAALDDLTLQVTLEGPTPYFIENVAHGTMLPVNKANVEAHGEKFARPGVMVSNGPFTLHEHVPNDHITLVKNDKYWDADNVHLDKVEFVPTLDQAASVRRYEAKELDMLTGVPTSELPRLKEAFKEQVNIAPSLTVEYYVFDTRQKPFDDKNLRRALSMVIDRDFIVDEIFSGAGTPAYSMIAPGIASYGEPSKVDFAGQSMVDREDKALELIAEAGYGPNGKPLEITIRYNTNATNEQVATAIAGMWNEAFGIDVKLHNLDLASHYGHLQSGGEFQVARASRTPEYADAVATLSLDISTQKTYNYGRFNSPDYDDLIGRSHTELDAAARSKLLHDAESILMESQVIMPLVNTANIWLVSPKVSGFENNPLNEHPSKYLSVRKEY